MLAILNWWLIVEVIGLLALPVTLRLLRHLPERGYGFAKPLGLLLSGYLLWIGCSFGFLRNTRTATLFVLLLVGLASACCWLRDRQKIVAFVRREGRVILATELVFTVAFFGWALVRAYNPEIAGTEKPMEIAFLNAILRSERFPPHDPWLSGFAISYYYFGYLLMAMLTRLSGVPSSIAFNLAVALLFALTAGGSFSLVYNLLATDKGQRVEESLSSILWALLGPLFVVIIGNFEGVFEVLHTKGLGSPKFWRWLDVNGLIDAPVNGRWIPTDNWWWWRASRVVNDRDLQGFHMEVIDEFPQFSFLLGDMHPHVLGLPFVLLALALALNILLGARSWAVDVDEGDVAEQKGLLDRWSLLSRVWSSFSSMWRKHTFDMLLLAFCLGALGFLNTWDLPIYLLVAVGAFFIGQRVQRRPDWLVSTLIFAGSVAVLAVLLYLPFYLTFQSQAGGVLPTLFNFTRLHQYLMMFGLFIFVIASLIVLQVVRTFSTGRADALPEERRALWRGFLFDMLNMFIWLLIGPVLLMALAVFTVMVTPSGKNFLQGLLANPRVQALIGSTGIPGLLRRAVLMRLTNPWTFLLLAILLSALACLIQHYWRRRPGSYRESEAALLFVFWIAAVAMLLTLGVEYVYLRDTFGTRMNTIFKFYYQAWVMMAVASAFGSYYILGRKSAAASAGPGLGRHIWLGVFAVLVLMGLVYPVLAIPNKAGYFHSKPTLDGMAFLQQVRADDYAAIKWLQENVSGMAYIVEATGGSFSDAAFVSAFTGLPTILGWGGHELQWRGNYVEPGKREPDIAQIYTSPDPQQVLALLKKYDVSYVYLGQVERSKYNLPPQAAERLGRFLETVYEQGSVKIYRR